MTGKYTLPSCEGNAPLASSYTFPSVYKGEIPILTLSAENSPPVKLWMINGVLSIEGDAEEGAKIMFEHFLQLNLDSFGIISDMKQEISRLQAELSKRK